MRPRFPSFLVFAALLTVYASIAAAQGAAAPAIPRTADGKPDLSGIWQAMNTAAWDIQDHAAQKGVPGGPGVVEGNEIPYKPGALGRRRRTTNSAPRSTPKPSVTCRACRASATCRIRFRSFRSRMS